MLNPTLLIVDDESQNIELAELILKKEGFNLLFATNADEAYRALKSNAVELILLDLMLPDSSGYDIIQALRRQPHYEKLKIVVVSALEDKESIDKAMRVGADGYITKPYDILSLKSKVKEILQNQLHKQIDFNSYIHDIFAAVCEDKEDAKCQNAIIATLQKSDNFFETLHFIDNFFQQELDIKAFMLQGTMAYDTHLSSLNKELLKAYSAIASLKQELLFEKAEKFVLVDTKSTGH